MINRFFIPFIVFGCMVVSCKTTSNSNSNNDNQNTFKNNNDRLALIEKRSKFLIETGTCMGTCPVFTFYYTPGDGKATVAVTANILEPGLYSYELSDEELNDLEQTLNKITWSKHQDKYQSLSKDLPTIKFLFKNGSEEKSVIMEGTDPEQLFQLKEAVIQLVKTYKWEKI